MSESESNTSIETETQIPKISKKMKIVFTIVLGICILSLYFFVLYLNYTDDQDIKNKYDVNTYTFVAFFLSLFLSILLSYLTSRNTEESLRYWMVFMVPFAIIYYILDAIYAFSVGKNRKGLFGVKLF